MSSASRGARAAARSLRQSTRGQTRRYASHGESHGHSSGSAYDAPSGQTGSEGFGRGFYVTVASIPVFYATYHVAKNPDNVVHRFVRGFASEKSKFDESSLNIHDAFTQQVVSDRFWLKSVASAEGGPPVRYLEQLNAGSPINVSAGSGTIDLSELIKHQLEEREKAEQTRLAKANQ